MPDVFMDSTFSFDRPEDWKPEEPKLVESGEPGEVFCLYMPVLHAGYWQLFARYPDVRRLLLVDRNDLSLFAPVRKDLHALSLGQMMRMLERLHYFDSIEVLSERSAHIWSDDGWKFIVTDEEVEEMLNDLGLIRDDNLIRENVFLRWTREKALEQEPVQPKEVLTSQDPQVQALMSEAEKVGQGSSDFWRQVGAVLVLADGQKLTAYNRHLPESETPYIVGDIRGQFHRGEHWELGSAIHAEAGVLAQAARLGKATEGATLYVTDFPCPACAKLIAMSGITTLYYRQGYTLADGQDILRAAGVEVIRVEV